MINILRRWWKPKPTPTPEPIPEPIPEPSPIPAPQPIPEPAKPEPELPGGILYWAKLKLLCNKLVWELIKQWYVVKKNLEEYKKNRNKK